MPAALAARFTERGFRIVSGGTDNHLMLLDLRPQQLTGRAGANALRAADIVANFNTIPFDPQPPRLGSGIRPGSPAITSRGMKETEMVQIADMIAEVLLHPEDIDVCESVKARVHTLCDRFPIYAYMTREGEYV